ncbi:hypothetical protein [Roseateles depolymerans]|uniref:Uncharacterized protein n=1 Tax=Roseateles depolymerans TaxID=76731 RepID=A0A0U3MY08_9BURK|nr:hypothetical protein [Roseateles depolymerans]ALV06756.1 hypothetical protein RD2015_2285 [Roseateles depolymerans]REG19734.1 hypothetical protein DES44_2234 [Roseateles depolymerans]
MDETTKAWFVTSTVTVKRHRDLEGWLSDEELIRLSGAPKNSILNVSVLDGRAIELRVTNSDILREDMVRLLIQESDGYSFHVLNAAFVINDWLLSRGIGPRGVVIQLHQARELGFIRCVRTWALGNRASFEAEVPLRGYYVWPLMGFDAPIPKHLIDHPELPTQIDRHSSLLDLMSTPEGGAFWFEHGETLWTEFDLRPSSRSWRRLAQYTEDRHIEVLP